MASGTQPVSWRTGMYVRHPRYGLGKVVHVTGDSLSIYFRDLAETKPEDALKKIRIGVVQLEIAGIGSDPWLDNIPPLVNGSLQLTKPRLTVAQQVALFKNKFPLAFKDPRYFSTERDYKWAAHLRYVEDLGEHKGRALLKKDVADLSRRAMRVIGKVNLLNPHESMALGDALKDHTAAREFFDRLFALLSAKTSSEAVFTPYFEAVSALPWTGQKKVATWPVATILPFLADPSRFMFLKPEVTKQAADRFPFDLYYDPDPNWQTYERLLFLCANLMPILKPLGAQDYIDVQSFIWVVGDR